MDGGGSFPIGVIKGVPPGTFLPSAAPLSLKDAVGKEAIAKQILAQTEE